MSILNIRSETFLRTDIEDRLRALASAHHNMAALVPQDTALYCAGYNAALRDVALSFGLTLTTGYLLDPPDVTP